VIGYHDDREVRVMRIAARSTMPSTSQLGTLVQVITGEPDDRKAVTSGSGRGPLEKDPQGHLASGLPVRYCRSAA